MPKFTKEIEIYIVQHLKNNPVLWDKTHQDFRNPKIKGNAWSTLATALSVEVSQLTSWYNTKRKSISQFHDHTNKNPGPTDIWALQHLDFLKEHIRKRPREETCQNLPSNKKRKLTSDIQISELDKYFLELSKKIESLSPTAEIVEVIKKRSLDCFNNCITEFFGHNSRENIHENLESPTGIPGGESLSTDGNFIEDLHNASVLDLSPTAEKENSHEILESIATQTTSQYLISTEIPGRENVSTDGNLIGDLYKASVLDFSSTAERDFFTINS